MKKSLGSKYSYGNHVDQKNLCIIQPNTLHHISNFLKGREKYTVLKIKVDIRKQVAIHLAQTNEHDKFWAKQVKT